MAVAIECYHCLQSWAMPACRQGGCLDIHRAKWAGWHRSNSKVSWCCDACCCNWGEEILMSMEAARQHMESHLCTLCHTQMPKPRWFAQLRQVAPAPPPGPGPPLVSASGPPPPLCPPPENDENPWHLVDQESPLSPPPPSWTPPSTPPPSPPPPPS